MREQDVVALLSNLRDLLQGDVGLAAHVLKALVGDVVIEARQIEGQASPQIVARFTINAVPVLAMLGRHTATAVSRDDAQKEMWIAFDGVAQQAVTERVATATNGDFVISLEYDRRAAARKAAGTRDGAS